MQLAEWFRWLHSTGLVVGIRQSDIWFPLIEGTHILALSFSVGFVLMLDLRLLGVSFAAVRVSRIMESVMKWALPGFALMFFTGLLLFVAQADKAWINSYFQAKMLLLIALGANALYYQKRFFPAMDQWNATGVPRGAAVIGGISLVLWSAVIALGGLMAYEL